MASSTPLYEAAFADKPSLIAGIRATKHTSPSLHALFHDISEYVLELRAAAGSSPEEPATKKRRLNGIESNGSLPHRQNGTSSVTESMKASWPNVPAVETSFSVPLRKKLLLQISAKPSEGIRGLNPTSQQTECGIPWRDIEHVVCLPVPEKAQSTYNFCVFPKYKGELQEGSSGYEPLVWTVPEVKAKDSDERPNNRQTTIDTVKSAGRSVLEPDAKEFVSEVQQAYRKGEKAYHVKAFRGSKDGFLFFLPIGIAWTFKKPLHFFSFPLITSISYTSVLQRTFNLNITIQYQSAPSSPMPLPQDFELSMIDQADFAGIDAYIKKHKLQDASMAEERRAKILNVNKVKGEEPVVGGETELQKAAREVEVREGEEDDEDEEDDENFNPGSGGESEGSGTSDEEDGEREGDEEEGDEEEELGSDNEVAG